MDQTDPQTTVVVSPLKLAGRSVIVAGVVATGVALLVCAATGSTGLETTRAALLVAGTTVFFVTLASVATWLALTMLNAPAAMVVLLGSLARSALLIGAGLAVQMTLSPKPAAFWAGLVAAWIAAKAVEVRLLWPAITAGATGVRSARGARTTAAGASSAVSGPQLDPVR